MDAKTGPRQAEEAAKMAKTAPRGPKTAPKRPPSWLQKTDSIVNNGVRSTWADLLFSTQLKSTQPNSTYLDLTRLILACPGLSWPVWPVLAPFSDPTWPPKLVQNRVQIGIQSHINLKSAKVLHTPLFTIQNGLPATPNRVQNRSKID